MNKKGRAYALLAALLAAFVWTSYQVKRSEMAGAGSRIGKSSSAIDSSKPRQEAPDFALSSLDGSTVSLSQFKGRSIVLLVFSATSVPLCRATMPRIAELEQKYGGKGLKVITVNCGEDASLASSYVKESGYKPLVLLDDGTVRRRYKVKMLPTFILVDKSGGIVSRRVSEGQIRYRWLEAEICKLLGLKLPPQKSPKEEVIRFGDS